MTTPPTPQAPCPDITPEEFLRHFPDHWIQYFDDGPLKDRRKAMATPHFDAEEARCKQRAGCGVFFSPNAFDGVRRTENLLHVQAVYVDLDLRHEGDDTPDDEFEKRLQSGLGAFRDFPLPPHVIIQTKNGLHAVWLTEPLSAEEGLPLFREAEDRLVALFGADPAVKDVTRVLRLPGFHHLKNAASPFCCRLLNADLACNPYPLADVLAASREISTVPAAKPVESSGALTKADKRSKTALSGVAEGSRNVSAASVAGKYLAELSSECWETAGWGGLKEWNALNPSPLSEHELRSVFDNIARRERARRQREGRAGSDEEQDGRKAQAQADRLVALVTDENAVLFSDQFGEPHAHLLAAGRWRACKVRGLEFRDWLGDRLWQTERKACGTETMSAALNTLAGKARFAGERIVLENRLAWHEGAIWYDLADAQGRAVRVTGECWEVVERPPILFRHFVHQAPQVCPVRGRPLDALLPFLNLAVPEGNPLLLVYLVTCFVPDIPHPIALFYGPQGAAKSTLCRLLRRLIDPTALEGLALPDAEQLPQLLYHHWFPAFDNVSAISPDVSDVLCRTVTGDGFSRRRLYSDDEDVIYHFRRCLCLNGINLLAERPDLLDRCLLFPLERIAEERRREEREVLQEFEDLRPELLGAVLDALSGAMRLKPTVKVGRLPRMADFARWGCATAEALSIGTEVFLALYRENIREQQEEAIESCPVAIAVTELMAGREAWTGTPTDLLAALEKVMRAGERKAGLPRRPNALTKQLNVMKTSLTQIGITVEMMRRTKRRRTIHIRKAAVPPSPEGPGASRGDGDGRGDDPVRCPSSPVPPTLTVPQRGSDGGDGARAAAVFPASP